MTTVRTQVEILREALERFRMGMYATRGNALHGTHSCPCVTCIAREALAAADEAAEISDDLKAAWACKWLQQMLDSDEARETMGRAIADNSARLGCVYDGEAKACIKAMMALVPRALNARGKR